MFGECCVPATHCPRTSRFFYRFPNPRQYPQNFQIWVEKTGNEKLFQLTEEQIYNGAKICGSHFDESRFNSRCRLKKGSLPTLYLPSSLPIGREVVVGDGEDLIKEKEDEVKALIQSSNNNGAVDNVEIQNQFTLGQQEIIIITHKHKNHSNSSESVQNIAVAFNHRLCQICLRLKENTALTRLDDDKLYKNAETVKAMLKVVIPEFDLTQYPESEICTSCTELVVASYELKQIWKSTEIKLKKFMKTYQRKEGDGSVIEKTNTNLDPLKVRDDDSGRFESCSEEPTIINEDDLENDTEIVKYYDHSYVNTLPLIVRKPPYEPPPKRQKKEAFQGSILCEQCGITMLNKRRMDRHLRLYHLNLICEACGEGFDNYIALNKHIRVNHKEAKRKLRVKAGPSNSQCHICAKVFTNAPSLKKHVLRVHFRTYNYCQCHICGKTLSDRTSLRTHLLAHASYKPHRCEICDRTFACKAHLQKHMRTHVNTVHYCNICGKKVKHIHSLEKHIKVFHLKEGEFTCDVCGRPYWKKFDLQKHKVRIHGWHPSQDKEEEVK